MFCYQCEQTAGCTGCKGAAGACGKTANTAQLQDALTGSLISLARASVGNELTASTHRTMVEGLFTTITNVAFDDSAIEAQIKKTQAEVTKLVPGCAACGAARLFVTCLSLLHPA